MEGRTNIPRLSWALFVCLGFAGPSACNTEANGADASLGHDRPLGGPPAFCVVDGHSYAAGESWHAADGCTLFVCGNDGVPLVALTICPPTDDAGAGPTSAGGASGDGTSDNAGGPS